MSAFRKLFVFLFVLSLTVSVFNAQGLHDKIQKRKDDAEKGQAVKNAISVDLPVAYADAYGIALKWMKNSTFEFDSKNSSKDNGFLSSTIGDVSGSLKKTGKQISINLIEKSKTETTFKVAVVTRRKLGADAWSTKPQDFVLNVDETNAVIDQLKKIIQASQEPIVSLD